MLSKWCLIFLVAIAIFGACCDGKSIKNQKNLEKIEAKKLARQEKRLEEQADELRNDDDDDDVEISEEEEDERLDDPMNDDMSDEEIAELTNSEDDELDDVKFQHAVLKRDTFSGAKYRHTVLSRPESPLHLTLVEKVGSRVRRFTTNSTYKWPHKIPYIIDPSFSNDNPQRVLLFKRALKFIMENVCINYYDETDNRDPSNSNWFVENGYDSNAYMLVKAGGGCSAVSGTANSNSARTLYPCSDFAINVHEILHSLGGAHSHQGVNRDKYITINRDNVSPIYKSTYNIMSGEPVLKDYFDPESFLMYSAGTWTRNGIATYEWIRSDFSQSYYGLSKEQTSFVELNIIYKCNELFCNNDQRDCGLGYFAKVKGVCRCVCPDELDPLTNCSTAINSATPDSLVQWPNTPMVVWAGGPNHECPEGFDPTPGWFTFAGIWKNREDTKVPHLWPKTGVKTSMALCSKNTRNDPNQIDWDSWPLGGRFCMFKPSGVDPEYPFDEYTLQPQAYETVTTNGSLGATTADGKNLTMRLSCKGAGWAKLPIDLPNNKPFRLWAAGACPRINGMREYKGVMAFFTTTKSAWGSSMKPQFYTFTYELQVNQCYFQPAVYGCNQKITLNANNHSVTVATPGFDSAREPDRRCFYTFDVPKNATIKISFNTYDLDSNDLFLVKRYHEWQAPFRIDNANYPEEFLSERDYLSIEYFAGYKTVPNKGVNFTATVILAEELCYDRSQNGADYTGDTNISETYEECLPWSETLDCSDYFDELKNEDPTLFLSYGNKCRNPGGRMTQPWCYTYKNGTNCQKKYCDVCNLKKPVDVVVDCAALIADDPDFCNSGLQRFGCFKSCNMAQSSDNLLDCPQDWTAYKDRCYKYISLPYVDRRDAEDACRNHGVSGTLFQIRSLEDQQLVRDWKLSHSNDQHGHWVSGELNATSGQWLYTDTNLPMTYFNWSQTADTNNPSQDCLKMIAEYHSSQQGGWKGKDCENSGRAQNMCQLNRRVTCGQPNIPSDGTQVSETRAFYSEGEKVTIKCNNYNIADAFNKITCTASGWTDLQHACNECPSGWTPYGSRCFYHSPGWTNWAAAADYCRSFGPNGKLFQIRNADDQEFVRNYRIEKGSAYQHGLWVSGALESANGDWKFTDSDEKMNYFNWASNTATGSMSLNCIKMIAEYARSNQGQWKTKSCSDSNHNAQYICQVDRSSSECRDKISSCEQSMAKFPTFCTKYSWSDETSNYCLKSCGKCPDPEKCSTPTSSTYTRVDGTGNINTGEVMTFACNTGYYHTGGDLQRACSSSGNLLGTEPVCQATPVATDINLNSLKTRTKKFPSRTAILLDKDGYRIPFDGKVTKWYYFCATPRAISLLIYRPNSAGGYTFVGANNITCVAGWKWSYNVPVADQIQVQQGDVFGLFTTLGSTVYANDCNSKEKIMNVPGESANNYNDLLTKDFTNTKCCVPSLGLRVEP